VVSPRMGQCSFISTEPAPCIRRCHILTSSCKIQKKKHVDSPAAQSRQYPHNSRMANTRTVGSTGRRREPRQAPRLLTRKAHYVPWSTRIWNPAGSRTDEVRKPFAHFVTDASPREADERLKRRQHGTKGTRNFLEVSSTMDCGDLGSAWLLYHPRARPGLCAERSESVR
jgi:hypothetical protein